MQRMNLRRLLKQNLRVGVIPPLYVKVSNAWPSFVDYRVKEDSEEKFRGESFDALHMWMCSRRFGGKVS